MKNILLAATFFCSVFLVNSTYAYTVSDVQLPNVVPANAERPELKLNGASMRALYLLIETYVGALYLEEQSTDPKAIMNSDTHKRMVFHVMLKKVGARRIASALQEALILNLTEEEHVGLSDELAQMLGYFTGKMHAGDESIFDYIPSVGTRITINNEVKGIIPGKEYFTAMLAIWIGENPVGRTFKEDVLGLNVDVKNKASMVADQTAL
jgi:hypothetical protein